MIVKSKCIKLLCISLGHLIWLVVANMLLCTYVLAYSCIYESIQNKDDEREKKLEFIFGSLEFVAEQIGENWSS